MSETTDIYLNTFVKKHLKRTDDTKIFPYITYIMLCLCLNLVPVQTAHTVACL